MQDVKDSQAFAQMPFESTTNTMKGHFTYSTLLPRLQKIRQVIDEETSQWVDQGPKMKEKNERVASNLSSQFLQCHRWFGENPGGVTLNLAMENDNPFVWRMVWNTLNSAHLNQSFRTRIVYFSSFHVFRSCFLRSISRFWFLSFFPLSVTPFPPI
jgi:hypothetical protein